MCHGRKASAARLGLCRCFQDLQVSDVETRVVLGQKVLHCSQHHVILNHWESSLLRAQKVRHATVGGSGCAIRQLSSSACWIRAQGSLHDIIGEDEDAREETVQEDENQVDEMKGDVSSRHADDTTNEYERKTPFFP